MADGRRQAGSGMARSRARARLNFSSQGQCLGRCRVIQRAERVSRPAMAKNRRRRVLVVTSCSPRPMRAVQRARLCAITCTASQAPLAAKRPEGRWFSPRAAGTSARRRFRRRRPAAGDSPGHRCSRGGGRPPWPVHRSRDSGVQVDGQGRVAGSGAGLLIIDALGFVPLSPTGAELLFEVFSQRYERGSILVTTNLPFDEWTEVFGSERLTGALLDRLTHHVHILEMNGDSYRLRRSRESVGSQLPDDA